MTAADNLDRIEALDLHAVPHDYHGHRLVPNEQFEQLLCDVLALVEIARAALRVMDLDYGYEAGAPHWEALRAALARLDTKEGT